MKKFLTLLSVFLFSIATFAQLTLKNDPAHSRIQFSVIHLGINDITGNLENASLTINADEKSFVNSKLAFTADLNTIKPTSKPATTT